jgi:hypothetical protein
MSSERVIKWGRRALAVVVAGLALQIAATFYWTPITFIASAAVGLPLVLLGAITFGWVVLRARVEGGGP